MSGNNPDVARGGNDGGDRELLTRAEVQRHVETVLSAKLGHEALLRAEVRREIENTLTAKPGFFAKLNSPFVITFLGGVLVTIATQGFARRQHDTDQHLAREHEEAERQRVVLERKTKTLSTFANDFETSNSILITLQSKSYFLKAHPKGDSATDRLGLSRDQVEAEHWEVWKLYTQTKKVGAEVTEVKLLFDCPAVQRQADVVSDAIDREYAASTDEALIKADHEANDAREILMSLMRGELHGECPLASSVSSLQTVSSTPSSVGTVTAPIAPPTVADAGH